MDTSSLAGQVTTIIGQLHSLFDDIGVPNHERESREAKLFAALSETLNGQLRTVSAEKDELTAEARRIIKTIRQMEASLIDDKPRDSEYDLEDDRLRVTVPLLRCIKALKEEYNSIAKLHRERFEQVKKLVDALESYSSHLEPSFLKVQLPPPAQNGQVAPTFDLSPSYVASLDEEFGRVYEEYVRRLDTVKSLSEGIISLWAELGIPQAQTDSTIVKHYRESPEQLGLHASDITRLQSKYDKLNQEKTSRETRIKEMKTQMEALWDRLSVEDMDRKRFLAGTRGCGLRVINEFEAELERLNELKRQNLGLFVEDARCRLQDLWDALYFSEEEMLDFTPAFSDVYSDALLSAHEDEIERLTKLKDQRLPTLQLIEKHKSLVNDREELAASSQDASRLIAKKGERRDPGKLLREEKMRKRIAKELPKVEAELRRKLEAWENDFGRPFLVHGQDYLVEMEAMAEAAKPTTARSRTPGVPGMPSRNVKATPAATKMAPARSAAKPVASAAPSRPKTPGPARPTTAAGRAAPTTVKPSSPSKLPRVPLSNMKNGNNSPERRPPTRAEPRQQPGDTVRGAAAVTASAKMAPPPAATRAPPPKMRDLGPAPPAASRTANLPPNAPSAATHHHHQQQPSHHSASHHHPSSYPPPSSAGSDNDSNWRCESVASSHSGAGGSVVRHVDLDDPYSDSHSRAEKMSYAPPSLTSGTSVSSGASSQHGGSSHHPSYAYSNYPDLRPDTRHGGAGGMQQQQFGSSGPFRTVSGDTISSNPVSGSENWETYDDVSEYDGRDSRMHPPPHPSQYRAGPQHQQLPYDADAEYYAKLRAAQARAGSVTTASKRFTPDGGYDSTTIGKGKKLRQVYDGLTQERAYVEDAQGRLVSASDAGWTDEDAF